MLCSVIKRVQILGEEKTVEHLLLRLYNSVTLLKFIAFQSWIKMSSSLKSLSQIWGKNAEAGAETVTSQSFNNAESDTTKPNSSSRRRLSKQFSSSSDSKHHPMLLRSRNVLTSISNLNVGSVPKETRKFFQAGAEKVTTTLNGVRSTIGNWSQVCSYKSSVCHLSHIQQIMLMLSFYHFHFIQKLNPSRRHQRLVNSSPYTPGKGGKRGTPRTKALLGRSPTKLYRCVTTYSILLSFPSACPFLYQLWPCCKKLINYFLLFITAALKSIWHWDAFKPTPEEPSKSLRSAGNLYAHT